MMFWNVSNGSFLINENQHYTKLYTVGTWNYTCTINYIFSNLHFNYTLQVLLTKGICFHWHPNLHVQCMSIFTLKDLCCTSSVTLWTLQYFICIFTYAYTPLSVRRFSVSHRTEFKLNTQKLILIVNFC